MKIKIFAAIFFTGLFWVKGDIPSEIILNDDVSVPLINNGKQVGTMKIKSGTTVKVSEIIGDSLKIKHINSETTVLKSKTNFNDVLKQKEDLRIKAETQRKEEEIEVQKARIKQQEVDDKNKSLSIYLEAKATLSSIEEGYYSINRINLTDKETETLLKDLTKSFIQEYENQRPEQLIAYTQSYNNTKNRILKTSSCFGYKYNEILKQSIATPIHFGVHENSDDFYLIIGSGSFITSSQLTIDDLNEIVLLSNKIDDWYLQCYTQGLDAKKTLGKYGILDEDIELELVSISQGKNFFIRLNASSRGTLIKDQSVTLSKIQWDILKYKFSNYANLISVRNKQKENSATLQ